MLQLLDDLIVGAATRTIKAVMAVGTAWVYAQALGLVLLLGAGVVLVAGMLLRAAVGG
jgi:hypothetical protein